MRNRCSDDGNIEAIGTQGKQAEVLAKPFCFAPIETTLLTILIDHNVFHPCILCARPRRNQLPGMGRTHAVLSHGTRTVGRVQKP